MMGYIRDGCIEDDTISITASAVLCLVAAMRKGREKIG